MRCLGTLLLLPALASAFLIPSVPSARARTCLNVGSNAKIDVPPDLEGKLDPKRCVVVLCPPRPTLDIIPFLPLVDHALRFVDRWRSDLATRPLTRLPTTILSPVTGT